MKKYSKKEIYGYFSFGVYNPTYAGRKIISSKNLSVPGAVWLGFMVSIISKRTPGILDCLLTPLYITSAFYGKSCFNHSPAGTAIFIIFLNTMIVKSINMLQWYKIGTVYLAEYTSRQYFFRLAHRKQSHKWLLSGDDLELIFTVFCKKNIPEVHLLTLLINPEEITLHKTLFLSQWLVLFKCSDSTLQPLLICFFFWCIAHGVIHQLFIG